MTTDFMSSFHGNHQAEKALPCKDGMKAVVASKHLFY